MKILWICSVWPEPSSSAAGLRTSQLIQACRQAGHEIRVYSACKENSFRQALESSGIPTVRVEPNSEVFDELILAFAPEVVIFDRFMLEEQFSWRVRLKCPNALRVLDTIDLHSLRRARQKRAETWDVSQEALSGGALQLDNAELQSEDALRELSSIYRSDLTLLVSDFELALLQDHYQVPGELLQLCRIGYRSPVSPPKSYQERSHAVSIGNFNHPPNADSFRLLRRVIWPQLRAALRSQGVRDPELHIYGAYPSPEFLKLDSPAEGFRVLGWTPHAIETLSRYRLNLAPLRFGAGIKGKITDGWVAGTPCVGSSVAAEGMCCSLPFGGAVADSRDDFVAKAAELYGNRATWEQAQQCGLRIIGELYSETGITQDFLSSIQCAIDSKAERRLRNVIGAMLWQHQLRSTEYFSRWIEEKQRRASCE